MKINYIIYLLIILFTFLIISSLFPIKEGLENKDSSGNVGDSDDSAIEGMDDCMAVTLSDIKTQLSDLQKQVESNSEELKRIKTEQETPTPGEKEAYSKVSENMPGIINSVQSD